MMRRFLTAVLVIIIGAATDMLASDYFGTRHKMTQPDGTNIEVLLYGSERYIDAESEDGYTLIRDDETGYVCYAMVSADGNDYASTGIKFNGGKAPAGLDLIVKPHARISKESMKRIAAKNMKAMGQDTTRHSMLRAATVLPDTVYGVCLMIDFADRRFSYTREEVDIFLNSSTETINGNARSIKEHFRWMSGGKLTYINYLPRDVYHAPGTFNDYSPYDATEYTTERFYPVIEQALLAINKAKDGFDLTDLTLKDNGIMAINVFYAGGEPENWATGLWPHTNSTYFNLTSARIPGVDRWARHGYQITNLANDLQMGTFVHENGHLVLGLPDFYSYEDSNNDNNSKPFNVANTFETKDPKNPELLNPYSMDQLGWLTKKQDITNVKGGKKVTLEMEVGNAAVYYGSGNNAHERYYLEVRDKHYYGWYPVESKGVFIWHVNEKGNNNYGGYPELLDCRPATERECMWSSKNGPKVFNDYSNPSAKWYDGANSGLYIWDFSAPSLTMTFRVGEYEEMPLAITTERMTDGMEGEEYLTIIEAEGGDGEYTFSDNGTLPKGLEIDANGVVSGKAIAPFMGNVTITVRDKSGESNEAVFSLFIDEIEREVGDYTYERYLMEGEEFKDTIRLSAGYGNYEYEIEYRDGDTAEDGVILDLPDGLRLTAEGVITGVPTRIGKFRFVMKVTSKGMTHQSVGRIYTDFVVEPKEYKLEIADREYEYVVGKEVKDSVVYSGGYGNVYMEITEGDLTDGLTLTNDGMITGTPTVLGKSSVTIWAYSMKEGTDFYVTDQKTLMFIISESSGLQGIETAQVVVVPNPSGREFVVSGTKVGDRCMLSSIVGERIAEFESDGGDITFGGDLEKGVYLLKVNERVIKIVKR